MVARPCSVELVWLNTGLRAGWSVEEGKTNNVEAQV